MTSIKELNPGISRDEFIGRRSRLAERIRQHGPASQGGSHHLVIIPSSRRTYMVDKIPYWFRQDTDFRYLTGCLEPDCVLVMEVEKGKDKSILFSRRADSKELKWEGPRTSPEDASLLLGVDEGRPLNDFDPFLADYRKRTADFTCWYDVYSKNKSLPDGFHDMMIVFMRYSAKYLNLESPKRYIHNLRLIKSPGEIALMRKSCQIAAQSIKETISQSKHLQTEQEAFATVDYHCRMKGAQFLAYPPVVAAGDNATVIHYINNTQQILPGELMLMDAGCEYHGYTSDITRTWPGRGGKFSDSQKIIYEIVLETQLRLLESLRQDLSTLTVDGLYTRMQHTLLSLLEGEGIIKGSLPQPTKYALLTGLCPHHVSHYLGMDVHDTGSVPRSEPLRPGMIITLEPGIYVGSDAARDYPAQFKGIGVRVEDDILIGEGGEVEVLSRECPKSVLDVEALCKGDV